MRATRHANAALKDIELELSKKLVRDHRALAAKNKTHRPSNGIFPVPSHRLLFRKLQHMLFIYPIFMETASLV